MKDYILVGNITNIKTGKLDANASSVDGRYPFFTCSKTPLNISSYSYDCECVLVAGNGDLNVKYYSGKFDAYQRTYIIESLDKNKWNTRFLYYFFEGKINHLRNQSIGGVIKYIKIGDLTSLKIPANSFSIQEQIVKELDILNDIIAKKKEQLAELDTLVQATFYHLFGDPVENEKGWKKGLIKDTVSSVNYGTSNPATEDGKFKYLRMNNITTNGYLNLLDIKYINIEEKNIHKYVVKKGDLLFNRTNSKELVGKTAVFNKEEEMIIAGYIIRVRTKENFNPYYIWGHLNSSYGKAFLRNLCKSIIGMANINAQELQSIPILLPPLSLQNQFAEKIEAIERQKELINQSITEVQKLFDYTMDKYF